MTMDSDGEDDDDDDDDRYGMVTRDMRRETWT